MPRPNTIDDILGKLVPSAGGCLEWHGVRTNEGYGRVGYLGKKWPVHRLVYEYFNGPVEDGLVLDHLCRNRVCANPAHLEPVTDQENILRGEGPAATNAGKTHCKHGHPFSGSNLFLCSRGRRQCRACYEARKRRSQERWAEGMRANGGPRLPGSPLKLSSWQIPYILALKENGFSNKVVADAYDVRACTIHNVHRGKTWFRRLERERLKEAR
jgi:hypothetical protein